MEKPGEGAPLPDRPETPLLDTIASPADLKRLDRAQLRQLADELRAEIIDAVSVTGGHLGAGLGVVELTVALHAVFNTPQDRLIWDVGHQAYPHKVLTGRRDRIRTLRAKQRPSGGFPPPPPGRENTTRAPRRAFRFSPAAPRANTTRSAPAIPRPRFPPASAWPSPPASRVKSAMS